MSMSKERAARRRIVKTILGFDLREERQRRNLAIVDVAEACAITRPQLTQVEIGTSCPSAALLARLVVFFSRTRG